MKASDPPSCFNKLQAAESQQVLLKHKLAHIEKTQEIREKESIKKLKIQAKAKAEEDCLVFEQEK